MLCGKITCIIGLVAIAAVVSIKSQTTGERPLESGDISVRILGKSGKMLMWRNLGQDVGRNHTRRTFPLAIMLDELKEVDENGNVVGKGGATKHSFNTFASQEFTFSSIRVVSIPNSNTQAASITFESKLSGLSSVIRLHVYVAKENGTVTIDGEEQALTKGQVKFALELNNWEWCAPCKIGNKEQIGKYVDVMLTVGIKQGKKVERRGGVQQSFGFGGGQSMETSNKVRIDDVWENLPANYPKYEQVGNKHSFTFRIRKFTSNAYYDPTIELGDVESAGHSVGLTTSLWLIISLISLSQFRS